jgi:hypothetical protein
MVALLTQLKIFQHVGRFLPVLDLPSSAIAHVAKQIYLDAPAELGYDRRTLYRHHHAIREYLGITPWGAKARGVASTAIGEANLSRFRLRSVVAALSCRILLMLRLLIYKAPSQDK